MKLLLICSLLFTFGFVVSSPLCADEKTGTLDVYWVDVEGGGGTLMVTPAGESILIDAGMPGERDPGRIHKVAAEVAGVKQIDHLITTHFHIDHFGGAAEVSQKMPVINVWDNGVPDRNPDNNPNDTRFPIMIKPYKEMSVANRYVIKPDDTLPLKQSAGALVSARCLVAMEKFTDQIVGDKPRVDCAEVIEKPADTSDNRNSIVTLISVGDFKFFVGGDLTWNTEADLVCPVDRVGMVDVYQVNHHGLDASNNPILIESLAPTVSVMSNGTSKGCGKETFATLKSAPAIQSMYQVHKNLREDSENNTSPEFIANVAKDCAANYIKMSVAPDGKTYTISIPGTGHSQEYQTKKK